MTETILKVEMCIRDSGGTILSMNPAACAVFHTDAACVGQPLLTVEPVSYTHLAGSAKIGEWCMFGGQVGIAGHITIGDR